MICSLVAKWMRTRQVQRLARRHRIREIRYVKAVLSLVNQLEEVQYNGIQ